MDTREAKVKVAVIGVGHLGQHHARIYAELPGVNLAAVVDISEGRRREVAGRLRVPAVADYQALLGEGPHDAETTDPEPPHPGDEGNDITKLA